MAETSSSFNDQTESMVNLVVKPNQNMIIDLDSSHYSNPLIKPMIECLKFSKLSEALTCSATVPLVHLSSAYSSAVYNKEAESVTYTVATHKTSISKKRFSRILGLDSSESLVDPQSVSATELQKMFFQMGYSGDISKLSNFKKSHLPPQWNGLFTLLFKGFSERVAGSDSASKLFYTLFYGLVKGIDLDFGSILWAQLVQSISSSTRHTEISCARFWSMIVNRAIHHLHVPIMKDSVMAVISTLPTATFVTTDAKNFEFVGSISEEMLDKVPIGNSIIQGYLKLAASGTRRIPADLQAVFDAPQRQKKGGKRKIQPSPKPSPHKSPSPPPPSPKNTPPPTPRTSPNTTPPPSPKSQSRRTPTPVNSDNEEFLYAVEDDDLTAFINTPFTVNRDSDEEDTPMTQSQFKELNAKLDSILRTTQPSASEEWNKMLESHKKTIEGLITENGKVLQKSLASVESSEKLILESTAKVGKLQEDISTFIQTFRTSHDSDVTAMNKVIAGFRDSLKEEKAALSTLRSELRTENKELSTAINAKVEQLQKDLAMENKIMDSLARQTQKAKVKSTQLAQASEKINELVNQRAVIRSCISDVTSLLRKTVETNDSVLTPSIRNHLTSKLHPAFCLLNQILGVSGSGASSQQGGESEETKPVIHTGEASVPKKRKRNIGEEDVDSEDDITNEESIKRMKRDKELDDLNELRKKIEQEEAEALNAKTTLETRKALFPPWTFDRIQREVIDDPKVYWLEPSVSFDLSNDVDSQLDFPITPKAFQFRCFESVLKTNLSDSEVDRKLFAFYLKYGKPQYETWSLKKIIALKVNLPVPTDGFVNVNIKGVRGNDKQTEEFTLADFPLMNPFDWISMFNILSRDAQKFEPLIAHLRRLLKSYIFEVAKMDAEIASALKRKPMLKADEEPSDIQKLKIGKIYNEHWSVVYKTKEGDAVKKKMFFLRDKHLYKTSALEAILSLISSLKDNSDADKKCFSDMIKWYLVFRNTLLKLMTKLFKTSIPKRED